MVPRFANFIVANTSLFYVFLGERVGGVGAEKSPWKVQPAWCKLIQKKSFFALMAPY